MEEGKSVFGGFLFLLLFLVSILYYFLPFSLSHPGSEGNVKLNAQEDET